MARIGGIPEVQRAIVLHPSGSASDDVLMERALSAVQQFERIIAGAWPAKRPPPWLVSGEVARLALAGIVVVGLPPFEELAAVQGVDGAVELGEQGQAVGDTTRE